MRALIPLALFPVAALAEPVTLDLPLEPGETVQTLEVRYQCDGGSPPFAVTYVNAGVNALAIVPVEGEVLVMANVLSGSGARYMGGVWEWWTKGPEAMLTDTRSPQVTTYCSETR